MAGQRWLRIPRFRGDLPPAAEWAAGRTGGGGAVRSRPQWAHVSALRPLRTWRIASPHTLPVLETGALAPMGATVRAAGQPLNAARRPEAAGRRGRRRVLRALFGLGVPPLVATTPPPRPACARGWPNSQLDIRWLTRSNSATGAAAQPGALRAHGKARASPRTAPSGGSAAQWGGAA